MRIGNRQIGLSEPPYIIAEIGVNHDGSAERAAALIESAAKAGADAVKLQLFRADLLMSGASRLAAYQRAAGEADPLAMLRRLELSVEDMAPLVSLAHDRGVHAIVTVFSVELVDAAAALAWDAFKTASPDIVHGPLLEAVVRTRRPVIVSTGASTADEVKRAVGWLDDAGSWDRLALLQCVSSYPVPPGQESLEGISALRAMFAGPVGYSDHTCDVKTAAAAVRRGATILEKHFTDDPSRAGPDHAASASPEEFVEYVEMARSAWTAGGLSADLLDATAEKRVLACEADVREASRQSIVTRRDLPARHVIARADVTFKRPGTGLPPWRVDEVVGRMTTRAVAGDWPLVEGDVL